MFDIEAERAYPTPYATSPLLPLILMSLATQRHSPRTMSQFRDEYDYIVVGAGSAGAVVASRLSEISCVSVLLLEAGGAPPLMTNLPSVAASFIDTDVDWQFRTVPQKHTGGAYLNRQLKMVRGKMLGGSSSINYCNFLRGNRRNFDDWEAGGAKGWSYEDVLPYFKKLESYKDPNYIGNGYRGVGGPVTVTTSKYKSDLRNALFEAILELGYPVVDPNGPTQTGGFTPQHNLKDGQRCSTAKAYLVPSENRTNFDIVATAFVTKVVIENRRAIGVEFDFKGRRHFVRANKEVVVSAGVIGTPQLLMLSGVGPEETLNKFGIPVHANLPVGLNLHDQCHINLGYEMDICEKPIGERILDEDTIFSYINTKSGILTSSNAMGSFTIDAYSDPYEDNPVIQTWFVEGDSKALDALLGFDPEVYNQVFAPYENKTFYICDFFLLQPISRGFITLGSANPYDQPLIDSNFLAEPMDLERVVEGMKFCNRIGTSAPMRKIGSQPFRTVYPGCEDVANDEDLYFRCIARLITTTGLHPVGTAKMGDPKDPTTVVDSKLRVKTIRGLRVADASVMPSVPYANLNAPCMMIGEKAADLIKETITCPPERCRTTK